MNCTIDEIRDTDTELFNVVRAVGPGDGINRMVVTVWDDDSIATYGAREVVQQFPLAVDVEDLEEKALEFLEGHKSPQQEVRLTYYFNSSDHDEPIHYNGDVLSMDGESFSVYSGGQSLEFKLGDTVRVVSESLEVAFTGKIEELDWSPGSVDMLVGQPAYNLIDVIRGKEEEDERNRTALGLPPPVGLIAMKDNPGVALKMNPYTNSRAVGVEIYCGTFAGFVADNSTLLEKAGGTRFKFPELESGLTFYFKVRSYDNSGEVSEFAPTVSAQSGYVDGGRVEEGSLDITPFASDLRPPRNVSALPDIDLVDGYLPGDMVVYDSGTGPRLYELRDDPIGSPGFDWVLMTAEDLADKSIAHQVVAGTVVAGAIGADEIAANAITVQKLRSGNVVISDTGGVAGSTNAVRVYNNAVQEVTRLGYIAGRPGVPAGVSYGLWGKLGTGVFIEGVPRLIAAGAFSDTEHVDLIVTDFERVQGGGTFPFGSTIVVPSGKKWVLFSSLQYSLPTGVIPVTLLSGFRFMGVPSLSYPNVLSAGSYSASQIGYLVDLVRKDQTSEVSGNALIVVNWTILEVDA